jgi:hypothetical protein
MSSDEVRGAGCDDSPVCTPETPLGSREVYYRVIGPEGRIQDSEMRTITLGEEGTSFSAEIDACPNS